MLKEITLNQAIDACTKERAVYKLTPVTMDDTIRELTKARFIVEEEIGCSLQTVINHIKQEDGQ